MNRSMLLDWLVLPLTAAVGMAVTRWGENNMTYVVAVPIFVLLWRMAVLSAKRPDVPGSAPRRVRHAVANWHALGIVACLFLMAFEAGVAGFADARVTDARLWAGLVGGGYLPFVGFSAVAEACLSRAGLSGVADTAGGDFV